MAAETELKNVSNPEMKKKGILRHFRFRKNRKDDTPELKPESTARNESPTTMDDNLDTSLDEKNDTPKNAMRAVRFPAKDALKKTPLRFRRELTKPPTAREAAFGGPPRYDWIDIVSNRCSFCRIRACFFIAWLYWNSGAAPWSASPNVVSGGEEHHVRNFHTCHEVHLL